MNPGLAAILRGGGALSSPLQLSGLQLWLGPESPVTRAAGMAAQFTAANTEYLFITDNASLSTGDIDFTIGVWVYLDSTGSQSFVAKSSSVTVREYQLFFSITTGLFTFFIMDSGGTIVGSVTAPDVVATGTWYFLRAWHDSVNNTVNLQVNNGDVNSAATTGVPADTAATFAIGATTIDTPAAPMNGRIQCSGFWKSVLTEDQGTILYNDGVPLAYDQLGPAEKDAASLMSYWELNEPSGTRVDLHGANDLTDTNTVTTNPGTCLNAVSAWADLSGYGRDATQATQANKPVIRANALAGKREIQGDGSDDILQCLSFPGCSPDSVTVFAVGSFDSDGDNTQGLFEVSTGILNTGFLMFLDNSGFSWRTRDSAGTKDVDIDNTRDGVARIYSGRCGGLLSELWVNGISAGSIGYVAPNPNVLTHLDVLGLGEVQFRMKGRLAEIIIYNRALNNAERKRVERYLSRKWGIAVS